MHPSPTRHRVAVVLAVVGAALSALTLVVHQRIESTAGYTSFCNLGGVVNCDAVLASRWGKMLGVPVAAWGLGAFVAGALIALPGALGRASAGLADLLLLGLVSASFGFALVLAVIAGGVLHHACLLCLSMDVVIVAWLVCVAPLAARFEGSGDTGWWRRRGPARAAIAGGLVLAVAGGTWAAVRSPAPARTAAEIEARDPQFYHWYTRLAVRPLAEVVGPGDHLKGPAGASVAIVEFSDFQCPFCVQAFRDLRDLLRTRPDVSLVFRHFPLDTSCNPNLTQQKHPDACLAACAAECAGRQGRFWEYHDALFENHDHLERESLFHYARDLGLDLAAFRTCLDDPGTRARVVEDVEAGTRFGIASTPTLFINGRHVEGALDREYYDYALILERHAQAAHTPEGAS